MKHTPLVVMALTCVTAVACEPDNWGPSILGQGKTSVETQQLKHGRDVYAIYCVGCHGEQGDGKGPAARFLDPKPRDFSRGRIKFAAVEAGDAPRDSDYDAVISHGLNGTSMPSFRLMGQTDRDAVIAYIKTFYADRADDQPGAGIVIEEDPWVDDVAAGAEEGKTVYHSVAKCWSCHPAYVARDDIRAMHEAQDMAAPDLRPDLYESTVKDSQWGAPIRAPDFHVDRIKTGIELDTLVRVIAAGVGGTAMPTWAGSLDAEQLWGLAYYVRQLALQRGEGRTVSMRSEP